MSSLRDGYKARYRELAKALHPDRARSKAAEEAFKVVTESFRKVMSGETGGGGGTACQILPATTSTHT